MRVLIVNTSEKKREAALAANHIMEALNNNGVKAKMLVRDKETEQITVVGLGNSLLQRWRFLWERWVVFCHLHFSKDHLFEIDIANTGCDITTLREFKEADIIHLHWINQGMLSLRDIRRILESGKPLVWTMHDIWPATSICHVTLGCRKFERGCHHCRLLPGGGGDNDLSHKIWLRKKNMLKDHAVSVVACSKWLASEARKSALLAGQPIVSIPNPIDTRIFCPGDRKKARLAVQFPADKRIILFVCQRITNRNKGVNYLIDACNILAERYPEMKDNTMVALLGGHADEMADKLPFDTLPLGYESDARRIVNIYRSADLFVLPSLSENLPNTIMEAMACGVPCVGFKVGGIPEMIDHMRNGYVAKYCDADDLAAGLHWLLSECDYPQVSQEAVKKVSSNYSQHAVAMKYIETYSQALALKHYHI